MCKRRTQLADADLDALFAQLSRGKPEIRAPGVQQVCEQLELPFDVEDFADMCTLFSEKGAAALSRDSFFALVREHCRL